VSQSDSATEIKGGNYEDRPEAEKEQYNRRGYDSSIKALQEQVALLSDNMAVITDFIEFWKESQGAFRLAKRIAIPLAWLAGVCGAIATVVAAIWSATHAIDVRIKP
jgi:hypothetical protein